MYAIQNESTDKAARQLLKMLGFLRAGEGGRIYECSGMVYSFLMYIHEAARNEPVKGEPDFYKRNRDVSQTLYAYEADRICMLSSGNHRTDVRKNQ